MLIIVLPLSLAALFVVITCLKFGSTCKSKRNKDEVIKRSHQLRRELFLITFDLLLLFTSYRYCCEEVKQSNKKNTCKFSSLQTELCIRGDWLEIPRSNLTLHEKLGEGAFGEAYKGLVKIDGQSRQCAVKKLKGKE